MTNLADELERLEQALRASDEIEAPEVFCTRETARALISALRREEWQGIETAPKPEAWFNTKSARFHLARFYRPRLDENSDELGPWEMAWSQVAYLTADGWQLPLVGVRGLHGYASLSLSGATHWRPIPLPPPPKGTER